MNNIRVFDKLVEYYIEDRNSEGLDRMLTAVDDLITRMELQNNVRPNTEDIVDAYTYYPF